MKTPKLKIGIMFDPVQEQLKEQGIDISDEEALKFESMIKAAHMLYLNRVMTKVIKDEVIRKIMIQLTTLVNMDELIKDMADQLGKKE